MRTIPSSIAKPGSTYPHASKRWISMLNLFVGALILTVAFMPPVAANPPEVMVPNSNPGPQRILLAQAPSRDFIIKTKCNNLHNEVYAAYIKAGASSATAQAEAERAEKLCLERNKNKK